MTIQDLEDFSNDPSDLVSPTPPTGGTHPEDLLRKVFPQGRVWSFGFPPAHSNTLQVGSHFIKIDRVTPPEEGKPVWKVRWIQEVPKPIHWARVHGQDTHEVEKKHKVIRSESGLAAWLSWVHRSICKTSADVLRNALFPGDFFPDMAPVTGAMHDLTQIDATWPDVQDLFFQPLSWKQGPTNQRYTCPIVHKGKLEGLLEVKQCGHHWSYGAKISMQAVDPAFSPFKYRHVSARFRTDPQVILTRAENLYAVKLYGWLSRNCSGAPT